MNKKKLLIVSCLLIASIIFLSLIVSAATPGEATTKFLEDVKSVLIPIFSALFGETPTSGHLFAKILFFAIILAVVWIVLDRIDIFAENPWSISVLAIATGILATRFIMTKEIVEFILLPYGTFGVALTAGIPLVIYFYIVEKGILVHTATGRKIAWIFFIVIFVGLAITRRKDVGSLVWIYAITAILSFIFLLADNTIRRVFLKAAREAQEIKAKKMQIIHVKEKMRKIREAYANEDIEKSDFNGLMNAQRKILADLESSRG